MNGRDIINSQSRRYYQDAGRNYQQHNWNPNSDFQRYDRKNRTNNNNSNFRPISYRGYDSYYQQPRYQDNANDPNGYSNYRRFEKDNYRYPPRFDQRRQSQEDKPVFEYYRQQQQIYPSQSKSSLSSEDQLRAKIDEAICIVSEQKKMSQVLGIYQAPVHSLPDQWD